jgi:hypothetical protein
MQTQYVNEMLNLPELTIYRILSIDTDELHLEAFPVRISLSSTIAEKPA